MGSLAVQGRLDASRRLDELERTLQSELESGSALLPPHGFLSVRGFDDHTYDKGKVAATISMLAARHERVHAVVSVNATKTYAAAAA